MGWGGPRWLIQVRSVCQSGQSGLGLVSSRPTEQPGGKGRRAGGRHKWMPPPNATAPGGLREREGRGEQVTLTGRWCGLDTQSDRQPAQRETVRRRGRAPKILGDPVNLPGRDPGERKRHVVSPQRVVYLGKGPSPREMQRHDEAEMGSQAMLVRCKLNTGGGGWMEGWDEEMDGWMDALGYVMRIATCCLPCKYVLYSTVHAPWAGRYVLSLVQCTPSNY